jgi:hypothetical protein
MFTSTATVHVIPNPIKINSETTCLITATADEELARYYRHVANQALHIGLLKPSWNAHITISKINPFVPMEFDKKEITFHYEGLIRYSGDNPIPNPTENWERKKGLFWFIDVYSDDIREIRKSLGLPDFEKFHLTIGILQKSVDVSRKFAYYV